MKLLITIALSLIVGISAFNLCGETVEFRTKDRPHVTHHGSESTFYTWTMAIQKKYVSDVYRHPLCLGTLVLSDGYERNSSSIVLTSARCLKKTTQPRQYRPDEIVATIGPLIIRGVETREYMTDVSYIVYYKPNDGSANSVGDGIAMLKLVKPIIFEQGLRAICLPATNKMTERPSKCAVAIYDDKCKRIITREVPIPFIDRTFCPSEKVHCTTFRIKKRLHVIGGSVMCKVGNRYYQHGVVTGTHKIEDKLHMLFVQTTYQMASTTVQHENKDEIYEYND